MNSRRLGFGVAFVVSMTLVVGKRSMTSPFFITESFGLLPISDAP